MNRLRDIATRILHVSNYTALIDNNEEYIYIYIIQLYLCLNIKLKNSKNIKRILYRVSFKWLYVIVYNL